MGAWPQRRALGARALFLALLSALVARLMMGESYEALDLSFLSPDIVAAGPSPASTTWLDNLLLFMACAALALELGRWRLSLPVASGVGALALAVMLSAAAACKTRLALNAGAGLVITALAALALAQLIQRRWMAHLLAAALLAACGTNAVKCIMQVTHEFGLVREDWEARKQELLKQGARADDPRIVNFERRMNSRLAAGHIGQPNVTGGCLAASAVVGIGALVAGLARRGGPAEREVGGDSRGVPLFVATLCICVLVVLCSVGVWLTDSLGALLAALGGLAALAWMLVMFRLRVSVGRVFALLACGYVGLICAGTAYGLMRGTLPNESLAFRWSYWQTALRAYPESPLTGLGRLNFLEAYLRHKDPVATEEVRDAHNLWVTLLVELGPLGLLSCGMLLALAVRSGLHGARPAPSLATTHNDTPPDVPGLIAVLAAGLGVLLILQFFSGVPLDAFSLGLPFLLLLVALFLALQSIGGRQVPGVAMPLALVAGLMVLLLHSLVDFTLLTQAGAALLAGLVAAAHWNESRAYREHDPSSALPGRARRSASLVLGACLAVAPLLHLGLCVVPTGLAQARLDDWRERLALAGSRSETVHLVPALLADGWRVVQADPLDARPARVIGRTVYQYAQSANVPADLSHDWLLLAERYAEAGATICPNETGIQRLLADIKSAQSALAERAGNATSACALLNEALMHWEALVALYPSDPRAHIAAGRCWARLWRSLLLDANASPDAATDAAGHAMAHFHVALKIDAARKADVAEKLTVAERAEIGALLSELERPPGTPK